MDVRSIEMHSFALIRESAHKAARKGGYEICGILIRESNGQISLWPVRNLSKHPFEWEIKRTWLEMIQECLKGTGRVLFGTYHSHVGGYAYPSEKDLEDYPISLFLMIYDTKDKRVGLWKQSFNNGVYKITTIPITCSSPKWTASEATRYSRRLLQLFRTKAKRNNLLE